MASRQTPRRGFTLLELLIVCGILVFSVGASVMLAGDSRGLVMRAQRMDKARVLAQNEIDYWRAEGGHAAVALGEGDHAFANPLASEFGNRPEASTVTVSLVEPGIVQVTASVAMPRARPTVPIVSTLTTWLPAGGAR